jgi:hypothetical protein
VQVSRRALSLGARASWLKIKCVKRGVFLIIGFIPAPGAIATLHLARRAGKALAYGRDGFTQKSARELRQVLEALATDRSPVQGAPLRPKSTWVRPGSRPRSNTPPSRARACGGTPPSRGCRHGRPGPESRPTFL